MLRVHVSSFDGSHNRSFCRTNSFAQIAACLWSYNLTFNSRGLEVFSKAAAVTRKARRRWEIAIHFQGRASRLGRPVVQLASNEWRASSTFESQPSISALLLMQCISGIACSEYSLTPPSDGRCMRTARQISSSETAGRSAP